MELYRAIESRRTVRHFAARPAEPEKIRRAMAAGLCAPSIAHQKFWQFIQLQDCEQRRLALAEGLKARDLKDSTEIEKLVAGKSDEAQEVFRRALPVQLTMMLQAPEVLVPCYRIKLLAGLKSYFDLNALASVWMCIENNILALADDGLYGCTYTPYEFERLKSYLGIPSGYEVATVIPFGYPVEAPKTAPQEPLEPRVHLDKW